VSLREQAKRRGQTYFPLGKKSPQRHNAHHA
jgi:hypothetical protein